MYVYKNFENVAVQAIAEIKSTAMQTILGMDAMDALIDSDDEREMFELEASKPSQPQTFDAGTISPM